MTSAPLPARRPVVIDLRAAEAAGAVAGPADVAALASVLAELAGRA